MTRQKTFKFFAVLLLAVVILFSFRACDMIFKKTPVSFSELIEKGNICNLSLTIYYASPSLFSFASCSIDDLMEFSEVNKVVVNGDSLKEHVALLTQLLTKLCDTELVPVESKSYLNARMYYILENKLQRKTFEVAMWGSGWNVYVNGIEVQSTKILFDVVMPFLPEEAAKVWEPYSEYY